MKWHMALVDERRKTLSQRRCARSRASMRGWRPRPRRGAATPGDIITLLWTRNTKSMPTS